MMGARELKSFPGEYHQKEEFYLYRYNELDVIIHVQKK